MIKKSKNCPWPAEDPLMIAYHDAEWGKPLYDDGKLFEFLILEGMQAGLSWRTVLHKRENFRIAFDGFDAEKIARYGRKKKALLMKDAGIIRNRLKIEAAIQNAGVFLDLREKEGSFSRYLWQFTSGKPIVNRWKSLKELPATTKESDAMSRALKEKGFNFVGSTICYAHMQATGMVNDHLITCFRHAECLPEVKMKKAKWFVYLVRCADNSLYTGITLDVPKRIAVHSSGKGSRCLRGKLPVTLVYQEARAARSAALKREAQIKRLTHGEKEALIRERLGSFLGSFVSS